MYGAQVLLGIIIAYAPRALLPLAGRLLYSKKMPKKAVLRPLNFSKSKRAPEAPFLPFKRIQGGANASYTRPFERWHEVPPSTTLGYPSGLQKALCLLPGELVKAKKGPKRPF